MPITGKTLVLGVWGFPVKHSLSPVMHNAALAELGLDWIYVPYSVNPADVASAVQAIRSLGIAGVNVTVPLKELVVPLLDSVDSVAAGIKSVNTIVNTDGELRGYSTDGPGLLWDLKDKGALGKSGSRVLVLGAGGSARSVVYVLAEAGCDVAVSNRTRNRAQQLVDVIPFDIRLVDWSSEELADAVQDSDLVINTTSLGMNSAQSDHWDILPSGSFSSGQVLYDLIYSPAETELMRRAQEGGATSYNGLGMLIRQGALSLHHWSGIAVDRVPITTMEKAIRDYLV